MHRCRTCQKPHHTLLHVAPKDNSKITSNTAAKLKSSSLLMTCRVLVSVRDGSSVEARALLDNASSASFVSERLAQSLHLPRSNQNVHVSGIAGLSQ